MRIRWDETKRWQVLQKRQIDFAQLENLLRMPYIEDQRSDVPEQFRLIGFAQNKLTTFVVEYRADHIGEYIWVVTAWTSTRQEARAYEEATR
jgi:uncharacterized DUF497 family protein